MSRWRDAHHGWDQGPRASSGGSSAQKKGRNHIPERWKDYLPVGQRMPGTRFIAFKVPLKKVDEDDDSSTPCLCKKLTGEIIYLSFEKNLAPEEYFSPLDLLNKIRKQNEELGLIIDLTYTQRYYKPEDLPETIPHLKIFTVGHKVPNDDTIFKFKCAVNGFLKENKDNDKLIGVHCTHGLNRTGYLICRYLIDVEGMRPDDAIELFNRCRGHCLERQNYIEDLQNGPNRKNGRSSVSRSSRFRESSHIMEPVNKSVTQGSRYKIHQTRHHPPPSRHFHSYNQDLQQPARKFSQSQNIYQRGLIPPPSAPGQDYSQRRYSWKAKSNASQATQNKSLQYPNRYYNNWGWTQ